jgi:hypothetical protein
LDLACWAIAAVLLIPLLLHWIGLLMAFLSIRFEPPTPH